MLATYTIFSDLMRITLPKLHVKLQPYPSKIFWAKVEKVQNKTKYTMDCSIMHNSCLMACYKHHLHSFAVHYLTKASCEISASSFEDFLSKGRKSTKKRVNCKFWMFLDILCIFWGSICKNLKHIRASVWKTLYL